MNYEQLQIQHNNLNIQEMRLSGVDGLKGLYIDGNIAIEKKMTTTEKACVLAEELGHHFTSTGNILDLSDVRNRKQELRARLWAYQKAFDLNDLISAYKHGCRNRYEIAEYLDITESFLDDAIEAYKRKYGFCTTLDKYIIYFEPLGILELYDETSIMEG